MAAAAALLAMAGLAWQFAGIQVALITVMIFGAPVAFAFDHLLRPPAGRGLGASLPVVMALEAIACCGILLVVFDRRAGIAFVLLASALASACLARVRRRGAAP